MNTSGEFFDKFAPAFDTFYDHKRSRMMQWVDRHYRSDMFIRFAMTFEAMGELKGRSVLDIGCGSGPYLAEVLKRGALHATGIDPAPSMLELARKRVDGLKKDADVTLLEGYFPVVCPERTFDFAIVMGVLDYVQDPVPFFARLKTLVTRGAAISFPSSHWVRTPLRKFRYWVRGCPVYFYTPTRIEALLKEAGIGQVEITKIPGAGMDYFVWIKPE